MALQHQFLPIVAALFLVGLIVSAEMTVEESQGEERRGKHGPKMDPRDPGAPDPELSIPGRQRTRLRHLQIFTEWFHSLSEENRKIKFNVSDWGAGVFLSAEAVRMAWNSTASATPGAAPDKVVGVKIGGLLMQVPEPYTLCDASLPSRPYGKKLLDAGIAEEDRVALTLLTEYWLGSRSNLSAWMQVIPKIDELMPPHLWDREQRGLIEPKSIRQEIEARAENLRRHYQNLVRNSGGILQSLEVFVRKNGQISFQDSALKAEGSDSPDGLNLFSMARVLWAKALVDTRAWNMQGRKWLVPGADMFNHQPDREDKSFDFKRVVNIGARSDKFLRFHKIEIPRNLKKDEKAGGPTRAALVFSDRTVYVPKSTSNEVRGVVTDTDDDGSVVPLVEVFESYGDNDNSIYLTYHGFFPAEENKNDCQPLPLKPPPDYPSNNLKKSLAEFLKAIPSFPNQVCVHRREVPPALLLYSLLLHFSEEQLSDSCVKTAVQGMQGSRTYYDAMSKRYNDTVACLKSGGVETVRKGLLTARSIVMAQYRAQFETSNIEMDTREINRMAPLLNSSFVPDPASRVRPSQIITALKFRVYRKRILNKLVIDIKSRLKDLQLSVHEAPSDFNDDVPAPAPSKGSSNTRGAGTPADDDDSDL